MSDAFETLERTSSIDLVGTSTTSTRTYMVSGVADEDEAVLAVDAIAPSSIGFLLPRTIDVEEKGPGIFRIQITYDWPTPNIETPDVGDETFSFDTGGATQLISYAPFAQTTYNSSGVMGTDPFNKFINVSLEEGKVVTNGVEIGVPALSFQIRRRFAHATLTFAYLKTLVLASFTWNAATFRGFAAGEVLFTHASGSQGSDGDPEVTLNFVASPNLTGLTVGGISGIDKKGHDYLWTYTEPNFDTTNFLIVPKVKHVSVAQVYKSSDFSILGVAV
jgi:hypothetical protein